MNDSAPTHTIMVVDDDRAFCGALAGALRRRGHQTVIAHDYDEALAEADAWKPGAEPASFDKQFVRNWLDASGWDHESTPPELPDDVVAGTRERYVEAYRRLTGSDPRL